MAFSCVKGNLPIAQWLYQSCVAQMWSQRAELILSRGRCMSLTCTSHHWWPPEWKIKYLSPVRPPMVRWLWGRGGENQIKAKHKNENAFALVVTPLRSLESREFTMPEWERIALNACTHMFWTATRALAHISMQPNAIQTASGDHLKWTECWKETSNCCWRWISSRQG